MFIDYSGDFDSLEADWQKLLDSSPSAHIFFAPGWGRAWWQHLGYGEPHLLSVQDGSRVVGIAPLVKRDKAITLLGDKEVCDYLDFVALPGEEARVGRCILEFAHSQGCRLDLYPLLPDSLALSCLVPLAQQLNYTTHTEVLDVSYMLDLPASWEEYLELLEGKQRHELKRKLRRLEQAGPTDFYSSQASPQDMEDFLHLFRISRTDKAIFMTPQREVFFRQIAQELGHRGWLKLYFLEVGHQRVAAALCFDYGGTIYLYNSGYDPALANLSVGLLCKALAIKEAIEQGRKRYDFLLGAEDYKSHLGGRPVPVHRCVVVTQPLASSLAVEGAQ